MEWLTPRLTLGRRISDKWAVQGRFYSLESLKTKFPGPNPNIPTVGANFATFDETDQLKMNMLDIELIRSFEWGRFELDALVGARHTYIDSDSAFTGFGVFTTGNFINLRLSNGVHFEGTGFDYGLLTRYELQ